MQLTVPYRGRSTISLLTRNYDDKEFLPIHDGMFDIRLSGDGIIDIDFTEVPKPRRTLGSGDIFPKTAELHAEIRSSGRRGLNIPECLALGNVEPDMKFVCLGQVVETCFGRKMLYVYKRSVGLLPEEQPLGTHWRIPVTRDPDPLKKESGHNESAPA